MKRTKKYYYSFIGLLLIILMSCEQDKTERTFYDEDEVTITSFFKQDTARFSSWVKIIEAGGIANALNVYNPYGNNFTVFAPTNAAVQKFIDENRNFNSIEDILDSVMGDGTPFVTALAKYHVVNSEIEAVDFSYGALKDTTATGDYINISFRNIVGSDTASSIIVNNESLIIDWDIEQTNGIVHVIDKMLEPSVNPATKWFQDRSQGELSIFSRALFETGVADIMDQEVEGLRNRFTVWAVSDEIFAKNGINSFEELRERLDNTGNLRDINNNLRIFMAYHISNGDTYINDVVDRKDAGRDNDGVKKDPTITLETFANLPMNIVSDNVIRINEGGPILDSVFTDEDTITINYTSIFYDKSNVTTRNGPIHFVDQLLEVESVASSSRWYSFVNNEPELQAEWNRNNGNYGYTRLFEDLDVFRQMKFRGVSSLIFGVGKTWSGQTSNSSYVRIGGDFIFEYTTFNKIVPGRYLLEVIVNKQNPRNADVQFYWDGDPLGAFWSLKRSSGYEVKRLELGVVDIKEFRTYTLKIESIDPGYLQIYNVILTNL